VISEKSTLGLLGTLKYHMMGRYYNNAMAEQETVLHAWLGLGDRRKEQRRIQVSTASNVTAIMRKSDRGTKCDFVLTEVDRVCTSPLLFLWGSTGYTKVRPIHRSLVLSFCLCNCFFFKRDPL
jgi:hypothetical protein